MNNGNWLHPNTNGNVSNGTIPKANNTVTAVVSEILAAESFARFADQPEKIPPKKKAIATDGRYTILSGWISVGESREKIANIQDAITNKPAFIPDSLNSASNRFYRLRVYEP